MPFNIVQRLLQAVSLCRCSARRNCCQGRPKVAWSPRVARGNTGRYRLNPTQARGLRQVKSKQGKARPHVWGQALQKIGEMHILHGHVLVKCNASKGKLKTTCKISCGSSTGDLLRGLPRCSYLGNSAM